MHLELFNSAEEASRGCTSSLILITLTLLIKLPEAALISESRILQQCWRSSSRLHLFLHLCRILQQCWRSSFTFFDAGRAFIHSKDTFRRGSITSACVIIWVYSSLAGFFARRLRLISPVLRVLFYLRYLTTCGRRLTSRYSVRIYL